MFVHVNCVHSLLTLATRCYTQDSNLKTAAKWREPAFYSGLTQL